MLFLTIFFSSLWSMAQVHLMRDDAGNYLPYRDAGPISTTASPGAMVYSEYFATAIANPDSIIFLGATKKLVKVTGFFRGDMQNGRHGIIYFSESDNIDYIEILQPVYSEAYFGFLFIILSLLPMILSHFWRGKKRFLPFIFSAISLLLLILSPAILMMLPEGVAICLLSLCIGSNFFVTLGDIGIVVTKGAGKSDIYTTYTKNYFFLSFFVYYVALIALIIFILTI